MSDATDTPEVLEVADREGESAPRSAKAFWPSMLRLIGLMGSRKVGMFWVFGLLVICVGLSVYAPKVLGDAVDVIYDGVLARWSGDVAPGETAIDFGHLGTLIGVVLGMYLIASVFDWAQGFILNRIVVKVVLDLRSDVERKVHHLPLRYYDAQKKGDILSRTTNDIDNVQAALQQALASFVYSILMMLGVTVMMFTVSWQMALLALTVLPVTAVLVGIVGTKAQKQYAAQWANTGKVNAHVEESFTGHDLVVAYGRQDDMAKAYDEHNEELFHASAKAQFLSGMMMPLMQFMNYLSYVIIAVVGALRVANGSMSLGAVTAFIQYSREFNQPLGELAGMMTMVQSGVASAERVFELLDAGEEVPDVSTVDAAASDTKGAQDAPAVPGAPVSPRTSRGRVEFRDVDFGYSEDVPLINDLNLVVEPGQTVAIVGPTGAGKTTMVNLVLRFYDVTGGAILVDGVDTRRMTRADLRSRTGMVLQDAVLFEGTILENIRYGRLDATDEEVITAAKAAYVDRFVHSLPEGYDTVIDQDGGSVSAGERQLITIARAFLAEPEILILDEATSSVDTRTEVLVQQAMNAIRAQRTSFVIAHRLSTIRDADRILVMVDGSIVEQGSHEELLEADGSYAELYRSQFAAGGAVE